jgi:predicted nucleic-acid-binding Zn-ribbon protein
MDQSELKLCEVCWIDGDGLAVPASYYLSTLPVCESHYGCVCQRCRRQWVTRWAITGDFQLVCDSCGDFLDREEKRREAYNQHLASPEWRKFKKDLRRENRREYGQVKCSRCGMTEFENKQIYGEGLHGHHVSYDRFGEEIAGDVELICTLCHAIEHRQPIPKPIRRYDLPT